MYIKNIIENTFSLDTLGVFLISAIILFFIDCKDFKKKGLTKEYKAAKGFAIFLIIFGLVMYIIAESVFR
ncbi:CLC_0170 family protein [Clostridium cylindrosporum]|uniref:Uncharacterized protein n=1 Tax=Clostridium cylindrosporum DSM 605 TaxID=1121307 RepID=A0A0J8D9T4_CLOCY|nr:CLC_0170 family protein [Clostridium cylindrosporum]KMT22820.1 hypothetical protein CLCY_5c00590 [Clostridium cylindrosporum DSM 605]